MEEDFEDIMLDNLVIKDKEYYRRRKKKILLISLLILFIIIIIIIVIIIILKRKGGKIICIYKTIKDNERIHIINTNNDIDFALYVDDKSYNQNNYHIFEKAGLHKVVFHFRKKLESLESFFENLDNLIEIDFSQLETEYIKSMANILQNCQNLTKVNLDNITPNLEDISCMFKESYYLLEAHLNFNTNKVKNMDWMFYYNDELTSLDLSNFDLENLESAEYMFGFCTKLENIIFKNGTKTKNLKYIYYMFYHCESLKNINTEIFRTNKISSLFQVFQGCYSLESIDISIFDFSNVDSIQNIFSDCINLKRINLLNINTSKLTTTEYAFSNCQSLTSLDISFLDFNNVTSLEHMFADCINLKNISLPKIHTLSNAESMFKNCNNLNSIYLNFFDSNYNGANFKEMFKNCTKLKKVKIENEEECHISEAKEMFSGCINLISIDLKNLNAKVRYDISMMFYNCKNLETLDIYNLNTLEITTNSTDVFLGIPSNVKLVYNTNITNDDIKGQIQELFSNSSL